MPDRETAEQLGRHRRVEEPEQPDLPAVSDPPEVSGLPAVSDLRGPLDRLLSGVGRSGADRSGPPALNRVGRLRAAVADRLPPGAVGVRLALDHWWLPVLVAVAALAVAIATIRFDSSVAAPEPGASAPGSGHTSATGLSATPDASSGNEPASAASSASSPGSTSPPRVASGTRPTPRAGAATAVPTATAPVTLAATALVVDIVGRVRHPGVVRLPAGARVVDALTAAGGALPGTDTSAVNLARPVVDGQQLRVGLGEPWLIEPGSGPADSGTGAGGATPGVGADASPSPVGAPLDLNTATAEQLDQLPGVGPATAAKIVEWRTEHGRFASVDDLDQVSGIGPAKLASLRPLVRV